MCGSTRSFYWLSPALLVLTVVVHTATFLPRAVPSLKAVLFLLYAGIVITFIPAPRAMMPMVRDIPHRHQQRLLFSYLSRTHRALFFLVLAYVFLNFLFTMVYLNEGLTPLMWIEPTCCWTMATSKGTSLKRFTACTASLSSAH